MNKNLKARKKGRRKAVRELKQPQKVVNDREVVSFRRWYRGLSCTELVTLMGKDVSFLYIAQSAFYEKAQGLGEVELRQLLCIAKDAWSQG